MPAKYCWPLMGSLLAPATQSNIPIMVMLMTGYGERWIAPRQHPCDDTVTNSTSMHNLPQGVGNLACAGSA